MSPVRPVIALAGASGDLGGRIARALVGRGADTRALVRPDTGSDERSRLEQLGLRLVDAEPMDRDSVAAACEGAACVVSALNGVRDVMIGRQSVLLDGAVQAGVPRFIPSDYSADFTRTRPGDNRNFDLRREFMEIVDRAPISATSILNGAFMDMLGREMPIIQPGIHRVLYWHDADQLLDFTTKDDTAAYVAAVALDDTAPRILRVAGDVLSVREIARTMSEVTGESYRPLWGRKYRHAWRHDRRDQDHRARGPATPFRLGRGCSTCATSSAVAESSRRSTMHDTPTCGGPRSTT